MPEPRGYWIGRIDVHDADAYQGYIAAAGPAYARFGARFLVRGGAIGEAEGEARSRNVVIEFPTYADALACYRSPEYQAARAIREACSDGELIVIEGHDGPQPSAA
ncbi:MAG: DUF1330 domain-containing protein [Gaiellales bacterium]